MIKGIIFDWDGVLVDSEPIFKQVEQRLLKAAWRQAHSEAPQSEEAEAEAHILSLVREMSGMGAMEALSMCRDRLRLTIELPDLMTQYFDALRDAYPKSPLVPNALTTVRRFRPQARLAIATSSPHQLLDPLLAQTGIDKLVDAAVSAEDVRHAKPAPDVYVRAVEKLGLAPSDCVAIEDTSVGVRAARAAGCRAIAIPRRETVFADFSTANRVVRSLADLNLEFLEEMDQPREPGDDGLPVAVYARCQKIGRADALLHVQLEASAALARDRGWTVLDRFQDLEHGKPWDERPGFGGVLRLVERGKIRRVVVTEPSVLATGAYEQAEIVRALAERDVRVHAVFRKEPYGMKSFWN